MGREKKLGIEACPKCGKLGRRLEQKVRIRSSAKWVKWCYFLHNDRRIPRCSVETLIRPKDPLLRNAREMREGYSNFGRVIRETTRRLLKLPLTDEELEELFSAMEWVLYNIVCPSEILAKVYNGKLKFSEEKRNELEVYLLQNLKSKKNIYGPGGLESLSLYDKYIVPAMINRRKALNQKLRDSYNYPPRILPDIDLTPTTT